MEKWKKGLLVKESAEPTEVKENVTRKTIQHITGITTCQTMDSKTNINLEKEQNPKKYKELVLSSQFSERTSLSNGYVDNEEFCYAVCTVTILRCVFFMKSVLSH